MTTANKITIVRVALIPAFIVLMLLKFKFSDIAALIVFAVACVSDFADGYIARKYDQVTTFGKFMDPLADKLLVCSGMICLTTKDLFSDNMIPAWIVVVIIAREFVISGFRLIAAEKGVVIAASYWGKFKTTFQMIMVILKIADIKQLTLVTNIIMYIALALTVISLVDYLYKNRGVMDGEM